jgi:hypothetical protein
MSDPQDDKSEYCECGSPLFFGQMECASCERDNQS